MSWRRRIRRFFSAPVWAGIAGVATVAGLFWGFWSAGMAPHGPAKIADPFTADLVEWGVVSSTVYAMPHEGPSPAAITAKYGTGEARTAIHDGGGIVFGESLLTIELSTVDGSVAHVVGIEPIYFAHRPPTIDWLYYLRPQGGGGTPDRVFRLNLDTHTLADMGVVEFGDTVPDATVRSEPLGRAFAVSSSNPARIKIYAKACTGYHEWGIRIKYSTGGKTLTKDVGTAGHPFRSVGKLKAPVPLYEQEPEEPMATTSNRNVPEGCS